MSDPIRNYPMAHVLVPGHHWPILRQNTGMIDRSVSAASDSARTSTRFSSIHKVSGNFTTPIICKPIQPLTALKLVPRFSGP